MTNRFFAAGALTTALAVRISGQIVEAGEGLIIKDEASIAIEALSDSELV